MTASPFFPRPRLQTIGLREPLPEASPPITTPTQRPYRTKNAMFTGTASRAGAIATAIVILSGAAMKSIPCLTRFAALLTASNSNSSMYINHTLITLWQAMHRAYVVFARILGGFSAIIKE